MIKLYRPNLSTHALTVLTRRQRKVDSASDPQAEVKRTWSTFGGKAREEVGRILRGMASGRERCMYCEDSMGTDLDHFRPKSTFPASAYEWDNLLLACSHCNSNLKRDEFPLLSDGTAGLIDPSKDDPLDHLRLSPYTGEYEPVGPKGEESRRVFGLNRQICLTGRVDAWVGLELHFIQYRDYPSERIRILGLISRDPFQGVRAQFERMNSSPNREMFISAGARSAVDRYPELLR